MNVSRRSLYAAVAVLVFLGTVVGWGVFRMRSAKSAAAAAPQSLEEDAAFLASHPGKWESKVLKVTMRDGSVSDEILRMKLSAAPNAGQEHAPDAQAQLYVSSPTRGIKGLAEVSVSLGSGSPADVRLAETNGVRTITITRAVAPDDPKPEKKQRIYDRFYSVSFRYELRDGVLTLKGFPTTSKVTWGVSEFTAPEPEISFKNVP